MVVNQIEGYWEGAEVLSYYHDGMVSSRCAVRINSREITVEYDDEGFVQYRGSNDGSGHFELRCPERNGIANLHGFRGDTELVGSWSENGYKGMWHIFLET